MYRGMIGSSRQGRHESAVGLARPFKRNWLPVGTSESRPARARTTHHTRPSTPTIPTVPLLSRPGRLLRLLEAFEKDNNIPQCSFIAVISHRPSHSFIHAPSSDLLCFLRASLLVYLQFTHFDNRDARSSLAFTVCCTVGCFIFPLFGADIDYCSISQLFRYRCICSASLQSSLLRIQPLLFDPAA